MYRIVYTKQAVKDIKNLKSVRLDEKAKKLIEVVKKNPFQNPPPYEALVGNLEGVYSRRINIQHRLVYQVYTEPVEIDGIAYEGTVKIIRMWTHYEKVR
jgi:toxin YoeB